MPLDTAGPVVWISDLNHAAWLSANDLRFLSAETEASHVRFCFADPDRVADRLVGEYARHALLTRFVHSRRKFVGLIATMRQQGRETVDAQEFGQFKRHPDALPAPRRLPR